MNIPAISTITGAYSKRSGYTDDYPMVPRCMAFVDMSSFTAFATAHGSRAAAAKVARFRAIVRTTTGKHGIRVARWLGDGALLVGLNAPDVLVAVCDIAKQCHKQHIPVHCGVANGEVIIFEGDDYLGSMPKHCQLLHGCLCANINHHAGIAAKRRHSSTEVL